MIFHGVKDLAFVNSSHLYFLSVDAHDPSKVDINGLNLDPKKP